MTAKFKRNELVIYWEPTDQQNYPAIIKEVFESPTDPLSRFSYRLSVDYGDENETERTLVDNISVEKYLSKIKL